MVFPKSVNAKAHGIIHQVILARNISKHLIHCFEEKKTYVYLNKYLHHQMLDIQYNIVPCSHSKTSCEAIKSIFSSPELKAQVSFSDHLSSVVCLSVCLSVCPSVNFSHFHLLLQNHCANFNQTWHKAFLGEGDSSLLK